MSVRISVTWGNSLHVNIPWGVNNPLRVNNPLCVNIALGVNTQLQSDLFVSYRVEAEAVTRCREYLRPRGDHDPGEAARQPVRGQERHAAI